MTKRLLSLLLTVVFAVGIVPFAGINSAAANEYYSVSKALKYAKKNWNNGVGLCAEFVSECLQAGGVDVDCPVVIDLYNELKGQYGKSYKLKLTEGKKGMISMADNDGKLEKGDPIFYKCNICDEFEHVVICNGGNDEGYSQDYAHNNAHDGKKTTYTFGHCGGHSWTMYSIRMYEGPRLYGKKNNIAVPKVSSLYNGADGVVVKWNSVDGVDKYRVFRRTEDGSWKKLGDTTKKKFTDKSAENGVKYLYTVKAVKNNKISQYYAGVENTCIGSPKLKSVKNYNASVKITWGKISSADGYYIYRKGNSGSWKQIAKIKGGKKVSYIDKAVKNSTTYKYTVRAYDGKVNGCYNNTGIKAYFLKNPKKVTVESNEMGAIITFNKVKGAKTYDIYRKKNNGGKWEKISNVVGSETTSFIDLDVKDGETYIYTVKSVNGKYSGYFDKEGFEFKYIKPCD